MNKDILLNKLKSANPKHRDQAITEIENGFADIRGTEDQLINILLENTLSSEEYERLAIIVFQIFKKYTSGWEKPSFLFNKSQFIKLAEKLMFAENVYLRASATLYLYQNIREIKCYITHEEEADSLLKNWLKSDYPFETIVLAFLKSSEKKYAQIAKEILLSGFEWSYSVLFKLIKDKDIKWYDNEVIDIIENTLLNQDISINTMYSLNILSEYTHEIKRTDDIIVKFINKYGHVGCSVISKIFVDIFKGYSFGILPKTVNAIFNFAIKDKNIFLLPRESKFKFEFISKNNIEKKVNYLIEILPPLDLILFLKMLNKDNNSNIWDGFWKSIKKRLKEPVLNDLIELLCVNIKGNPQIENSMEKLAKYSYNNDIGKIVVDSFHYSSSDKISDEVEKTISEWLKNGKWYQKECACRMIYEKKEFKDILSDVLGNMKSINNAEDMCIVNTAYAIKHPVAGVLYANAINENLNHYACEKLVSSSWDSYAQEDKNNYEKTVKLLNSAIDKYNFLLPDVLKFIKTFHLKKHLGVIDKSLKAGIIDDYSYDLHEIMDSVYEIKRDKTLDWANAVIADINNGKYKFFATKIIDTFCFKSIFKNILALIPQYDNFMARMFDYKISGDLELREIEEIVPGYSYLGKTRGAKKLLYKYVSMSSNQFFFLEATEIIDKKLVIGHLTKQLKYSFHKNDYCYLLNQFNDSSMELPDELFNLCSLILYAAEPEHKDFIEFITQYIDSAFSSELEIVRAIMNSPNLRDEINDEDYIKIDSVCLLWNFIVIARYLAGLEKYSPNDIDPAKEKSMEKIFMIFDLENEKILDITDIPKKLIMKYFVKRFNCIPVYTNDHREIMRKYKVKGEEIFPFISKETYRRTIFNVTDLYAYIFDKLSDKKLAKQLEDKLYILYIPDTKSFKNLFEINDETALIDFETFCKIAMYLKIEYDEDNQCIVRVSKTKSIEVIAKLLSGDSGYGTIFAMKEM